MVRCIRPQVFMNTPTNGVNDFFFLFNRPTFHVFADCVGNDCNKSIYNSRWFFMREQSKIPHLYCLLCYSVTACNYVYWYTIHLYNTCIKYKINLHAIQMAVYGKILKKNNTK